MSAQRRSPLDEAARPAGTDVKDLLIDPLDQFLKDYLDKTRLDRTILDHLLHQAFADSDERAEPETDLLLAPDPDEAGVRAVLGRYGFKDVAKAYQNLSQLARESVPFLSARRCRHFLAGIAPQLLRAAADTPDPDEALNNLERVTASLGAKAVLYELFIANPPSLRLYVDLCAGSPFLSGLLTNNPGMIDDLLDSLVLDQPRPAAELNAELTELCRGATDPDPILHSFQDKEVLRIGVRDLLNKDTVRETTAALSDVADAVVNAVFDLHEPAVRRKYGVPVLSPLSASGRGLGGGVASEEPNPPAPFPKREGGEQPCRYAVVGLGKLGGREISYHSDLDLIVLFEGDGTTDPADAGDAPAEPTTNAHYFTDLTQRAINALSRAGPMGRLYAVDMRLRPTGRSGRLVLTLAEFRRYFASPDAGLWERQTLTRARVVRGDPSFAAEVEAAVRGAALAAPWRPAVADEIRAMRARLEATASPRSLKRGPGGLVDVEFLVQLLQLKHGREKPEILQPNVWAALDALRDAGLLSPEQAEALRAGYSFLRRAEARLRVVTDRPLTEVPEAADDRDKLARRLGFDGTDGRRPGEALADELARVTGRIRAVFEAVTNPGGEIRSPKPEARNKSESPNPQ